MSDFHPPTQAIQEYATYKLDLLKVGASFVVDNASLSRRYDDDRMGWVHDVDRAAYDLTSYVLADHLVSDEYKVTVDMLFPSSWWQHFKQQYGRKWWLRWYVDRWPLAAKEYKQTKTVTFDRYATYPDARIRVPDLGPVYIQEFVREG